jgi:hypothetical protein
MWNADKKIYQENYSGKDTISLSLFVAVSSEWIFLRRKRGFGFERVGRWIARKDRKAGRFKNSVSRIVRMSGR